MKFACDSCGSQYMISDEKVGPNGVKVRCKKCGNVVAVKRPPASAPEVSPAPSPERAAGAPEGGLESELGHAFDSAFGTGGPAGPAASPPADLGDDWYVAVDDNQVGPLPAEGVKTRWESGEVGPDTLAWRPGMADWVPISTIAEMAQYLAPVPRGGKPAARPVASAGLAPAAAAREERPAPAPAAPSAAPAAPAAHANGHVQGAQGAWKPSAASALAALASEEMASLEKPERKPAESTVKSGSLVDKMELPDGGVDPTNLIPLTIKGLEQTTDTKLERPRSTAADRTEIRQIKKSAVRSVVAVGVAMLVLFGVAVAAIAWYLKPHEVAVVRAPAAAPPVAAAPAPTPPPAVAPAPAPVAPAPAPTPPPVAQAAPPAAAPAPAAPAREPARAEAPPAREPARAAAPSRRAPAEPPARPARRPAAPQRVASSEPAPRPAPEPPARRKPAGDPLLDVGGDEELEKELGGKPTKRSVYVPPALGADLPDSVSQSQIQEAVAGQKSALLRCIEQQRAADPNARGTLRLRWLITGDGGVREVRVLSDEFARQPVAPCISGVVKGIRFPRSRTTGQEVVFPFKF
ncbi:GYF domain-containing protein [Anaeromyxobacter diazotrophicus]|uniref:MJ0042 family finger-like protein n=1 Tax=Anaeromyxobacter diazotrophicus TaxID=2590199 RepID=A0A7I9VIH0_9BACT|nr:GYF domain-containing protein [Anaeromyxobacter diazotrophicus]GEJ55928.1 hypothetical protein AMYX_06690 [Anaeromyxobacter diazotrophicus]